MKKILFITFFILTTGVAFAQYVNYTTTKNDATGDNLWLVFDPIYLDFYYADINGGWSGEIDLRIKKLFTLTAIYRQPYKGKPSKSDFLPYNYWRYISNTENHQELYTSNKLKPLTYFEGNIALHLIDKVKNANIRVVLRESTSTNYWSGTKTTHTTSISVPGDIRTIFALRGGYIISRTPLYAKKSKIKLKKMNF